jgi:hypothetical protein
VSNSMFPNLPFLGAFSGGAAGKGGDFCFLSAASQGE